VKAKPKVSAIVAVYNEERHLSECLESLLAQSYEPLEVIVADDGSNDLSVHIARRYPGVRVLLGSHVGKAKTLNSAAMVASGEIVLFLDGDLYFDREYVAALVRPLISGVGIGSCHATEHVANPDNPWSRCCQRKAGLPINVRLLLTQPEIARGSIIFRALWRDLFVSVGGFNDTGHTDDQTLHPKVGRRAMFIPEAVCYHYNVETLGEVFGHGVWSGKSIYHRYGARALAHYVLPRSVLRAIAMGVRSGSVALVIYELVTDLGIFWGVLKRTLSLDRTNAR